MDDMGEYKWQVGKLQNEVQSKNVDFNVIIILLGPSFSMKFIHQITRTNSSYSTNKER